MSSLAITPQPIGVTVPLDPGVELIPLSDMALSSYCLAIAAGSPHRALADMLAAARARPGLVTFSSPGPGSASTQAVFSRRAAVRQFFIATAGFANLAITAELALSLTTGRLDSREIGGRAASIECR